MEMLPKARAHHVHQEILIVQHLCRMHAYKKVRPLRQATQQVGVRDHMVRVLLEHGLHLRHGRRPRGLLQLPPILIHLEDGKCAVHARILEELFTVQSRAGILTHQHPREKTAR